MLRPGPLRVGDLERPVGERDRVGGVGRAGVGAAGGEHAVGDHARRLRGLRRGHDLDVLGPGHGRPGVRARGRDAGNGDGGRGGGRGRSGDQLPAVLQHDGSPR